MQIPQDVAETIVDPKAFAAGDPVDEAYSFLRREMPLAVAEPAGFDPFWVVSKQDDIRAVERDNDLFHNGDRATTLVNIEGDQKVREMMGGSPHLIRSLVQMDNPDHMKYRRLTQGWFMPQNIRKLEDRIREIARETIDHMASFGGECDFARDVAFLYPLRVIMEILGVPREDEPKMLKLTQELFGATDPDTAREGQSTAEMTAEEAVAALQATVAEFFTYFNALTEDRRANPRDDVASVIANGSIDGAPLGPLEAIGYYIIVATAGHDTTSNTTAGGLWALAERPDQFAMLKANPGLISSYLDESIRWVTPVKHFMRTATADTELAGQQISKNDWMLLAYPSGNRDEAVYGDPFEFRIDRSPNKHVAFGYGAHVCLGQHLGKMEMRILWEELLPRLDALELSGTPTRTQAAFVCGPKSVPIRYRMS